jgi:hypothetical protein
MSSERLLSYEQGKALYVDVHSLVSFAQGYRDECPYSALFTSTAVAAEYAVKQVLSQLQSLCGAENVSLVRFESWESDALVREDRDHVFLRSMLLMALQSQGFSVHTVAARESEEVAFLSALGDTSGVFGLWMDLDAGCPDGSHGAWIAKQIELLGVQCIIVPGSIREAASEGGCFGIFYDFSAHTDREAVEGLIDYPTNTSQHKHTQAVHLFSVPASADGLRPASAIDSALA